MTFAFKRAVSVGTAVLLLCACGSLASAQSSTEKERERAEMKRALLGEEGRKRPKARTRSIGKTRSIVRTRSARSMANRSELSSIVKGAAATRGMVVKKRERLHELTAAERLPSLNLEIYFAKNSDRIDRISIAKLEVLGDVMKDGSFAQSHFLIFGHTDASGSDGYNLTLSRRRAAAVRRFLSNHTGIAGERLVAVGYGEEKLKNEDDPEAAENRRVQIVNFAE